MKNHQQVSVHLGFRLGLLLLIIAASLILAACGSARRSSKPVVNTPSQVRPSSTPTISPTPTPVPVTPSATFAASTTPPTSTPTPTSTPNPHAAEFALVSRAFKQDFKALQTINPDIQGWIEIEAAGINHPVLLGPDNEYYLTIGFDNKAAKMGSIYFDMRFKPEMSDQNVVIYGHNWDNGRMFSNLMRFRNKRVLEENPEFYLYTPLGIFRAQIAAIIIVKPDDPTLLVPNFETKADLKAYLDKLNTKAEFRTKVELKETDRFLSLYTCTNNAKDDRIIFISKLIEIGRYK